MSRYFWSITSVIGLTIWLVGSYAPPAILTRWQLALPGSGRGLQMVALVCLLLFVIVQLWLLWATFALRRLLTTSFSSPWTAPGLQVRLGAELFWTLLPLVITLGLAWLAYPIWLSVPTV